MSELTEGECIKDFEKQVKELQRVFEADKRAEVYKELKELTTMFVEVVKMQDEKIKKHLYSDTTILNRINTSGWPERQRKAKEEYETLIKICDILKKEVEKINKELN